MSRRGGDLQVQRAEELRLAASKAFHEADASQALKNALHGGPRPIRDFEVGQMVYFWRKGTDGPKKNQPGFWRGPGRVVLTSPPSTIWVNYRGFIVKAAPEQIRLASEEERFTLTGWINDLTGTREEIEKFPRQGYIDLTKDPFPTDEAAIKDIDETPDPDDGPRFRLHGKTAIEDIQFRAQGEQNDEWILDEKAGQLHRIHRQPRDAYFQPSEDWLNCPVDRSRIRSRRTTRGVYTCGGESFQEEDDWIIKFGNEIPMMPWTGRTTFQLHPPEEPHDGRDLPRPDHQRSGEDWQKMSQAQVTRVKWRRDEDEMSGPSHKRHRANLLDTYLTSVEKVMAAKLKKEVKFNELDKQDKEKFRKAMEKEVQNNLKTQAYIILTPEESAEIRRNSPEKIVKSRFVMTEKNIDEDEIEKAKEDGVLLQADGPNSTKAKARHVMKGFSEENSENLETTTPQCGRETVLSVLQLICSRKWVPGYLDFTQAFHSGDEIQREIYAAQPHDCPLPGYSPRQLLKLLKTCYGLLDGPYAWYQHLKKVLLNGLRDQCSRSMPVLSFR